MKLIFMGTPDFSVPALEALVTVGHDVIAVYTQPPRPAGRGHKLQKSPVHLAAEKHNIPVKTPKSLKNAEEQQEFTELKPDKVIVAAYGLILPKAIIDYCPCLNIHASLLPRWRGAAPIQRAILAGDKVSGVTIMNMDEGLDTGDMLSWEDIDISNMNAGQLHDALSELGAKMILEALEVGSMPVKQTGEATYANKISKEEAHIDWNNDAEYIGRQVRAFNPFPGAYFMYKGEKIKILECQVDSGANSSKPGEIIDDRLSIACKNGIIKPKTVQRQGKKAMSVEDMLRGFNIGAGEVL